MKWFDLEGKSEKKAQKSKRDNPSKEELEQERQIFKYEQVIPWVVTTAFALALNDFLFTPIYSIIQWIVTGVNTLSPDSLLYLIVSVTFMITLGIGMNRILFYLRMRNKNK